MHHSIYDTKSVVWIKFIPRAQDVMHTYLILIRKRGHQISRRSLYNVTTGEAHSNIWLESNFVDAMLSLIIWYYHGPSFNIIGYVMFYGVGANIDYKLFGQMLKIMIRRCND